MDETRSIAGRNGQAEFLAAKDARHIGDDESSRLQLRDRNRYGNDIEAHNDRSRDKRDDQDHRLQFGHFRKVKAGKMRKFSLVEIFCWSRKVGACNDLRKWSHYTFRAVS